MAGFGDDNFFFNPRGAPPIGRWPESFECKHHARFDLARVLQRNQAADHRLLPDGKANSVTILQRKCRFFVGKPELLRLGPDRSYFGCGSPRTYEFNRRIEILAASLVSVVHGMRSVSDGEAAVVASAIAHVGVKNVVINRIAGAQYAIGENMGMRIAALARNRIYSLYIF